MPELIFLQFLLAAAFKENVAQAVHNGDSILTRSLHIRGLCRALLAEDCWASPQSTQCASFFPNEPSLKQWLSDSCVSREECGNFFCLSFRAQHFCIESGRVRQAFSVPS